jgi:hypothetical protein
MRRRKSRPAAKGIREPAWRAIQLVKEGAPRAPVEDTTVAATAGRW